MQTFNSPELTPDAPVTPATAQKTNRRAIMLLAIIAVLLIGALLRFTLTLPKADSAHSTTATSLTGAPPFGTATPVSASASGQAPGGSYYNATTPFPTQILRGNYPDPRVDTAQEQAMRQNRGNPDKMIMISLSGQFIQAFDHGKLVHWEYVTTGRATLDTPTGSYRIGWKLTPFTFEPISKDPASIEFGIPSKVQYAMEFADGGYYVHDVWWRSVYGPGLNNDHWDPARREFSPGSHGCVNTPLEMMTFLFLWAPVGTPVQVFY